MVTCSIIHHWRAALANEDWGTVERLWDGGDQLAQNQAWIEVCAEGDRDLAEAILGTIPVDPHHDHDRAWRAACAGGHLETARWLWGLGVDMTSLDHDAWRQACLRGHLPVVRWLLQLGIGWSAMIEMRDAVPEVYRMVEVWIASRQGGRSVVTSGDRAQMCGRIPVLVGPPRGWSHWIGLAETGQYALAAEEWRGLYPDDRGLRHWWSVACARGQLGLAQWIWDQGGIDLCQDGDEVWWNACTRGDLPMARWLWSLGGLDPHYEDDLVWRIACIGGDLPLVRWLWELGVYHLPDGGTQCWEEACGHGHLALAQWWWEQGTIDRGEDLGWRWACARGHLEVVAWRLTLGVSERWVWQWQEIGTPEVVETIRLWLACRRHKSARSGPG